MVRRSVGGVPRARDGSKRGGGDWSQGTGRACPLRYRHQPARAGIACVNGWVLIGIRIPGYEWVARHPIEPIEAAAEFEVTGT